MKNINLILMAVMLVVIAVTPSFATRTYDFNLSGDTISWYAIDESGLEHVGIFTLSWNSTAGINGGGCLQLVVNKTDPTIDEKFDISISAWNNLLSAGMPGPKSTFIGIDTTWGLWVRCTTDLSSNTTLTNPPVYCQAYGKDNGWTWHDVTLPGHGGVAFNASTSWQQCYVRVTTGTSMPYQELGVQIYLSVNTGSYTFYIDNAKLAPDQTRPDWPWRIDGAGNATWLANGNGARGLAYNPVTDHVLISNTDNGNNIMIRNAADGTAPDSPPQFMNMTGVVGGTYTNTKVRTTSDGVIYASNLTTNDTTVALTIYRWANEAASVTTTYKNRAASAVTFDADSVGPLMPSHAGNVVYRIGDGFDVVMSMSTVDFYFGVPTTATGANLVYKFRSIDGGLTIDSITPIALIGGGGSAYRGTALDGFDGDIYSWSNADSNMGRFTNPGGVFTSFPASLVGSNNMAYGAHPRIRSFAGRKYIGFIYPITAFGGGFRVGCIADITNGPALAGVLGITDPIYSVNANANGTGDFDFDTTRNRFLFLVTNNFVGTYDLGTGITKTWDGGGGNNAWANFKNWNPDGVPTGNDNVVLDNSNVAGSYLVTIGDITAKGCRTLTVGDTVSGNTITLDITGAGYYSLIVGGTQSVNTSILVRNGGKLQNRAIPAGGYVIQNQNGGNIYQVLNGGYAMHSTTISFSTPYPATGNGAIAFDPGATMNFWLGSAAATMSGRTYPNLVLNSNSGAAVTMTAAGGQPAIIQNDLTIGPFVTFNPSMTGVFAVKGNINNNGISATLSCTSTEGMALNGSSGQSIFGTGTVRFSGTGVTLDNPAGLTQSNPNVIVNGTLFMKNGNITTGANTLTIGTSVTIIGNVSRTSGAIIGNLNRWVPASNTTLLFPVGTATSYNGAQVAFTSPPTTGGNLVASFTPITPSGVGLSTTDSDGLLLINVVPGGTWSINSANGLGGGIYDLTLNDAGFNITVGIDSIRIAKVSPWGLDGSPGTNSGTSIVRTGLTGGFSTFTLVGPAGQVPVELSRFDAIIEPRK